MPFSSMTENLRPKHAKTMEKQLKIFSSSLEVPDQDQNQVETEMHIEIGTILTKPVKITNH